MLNSCGAQGWRSQAAWLLSAACLAGPGAARADDIQSRIDRDETVSNRPHPETDPLGVRVGSFLLSPDVALDSSVNDNVYVARTAPVTDELFTVKPHLAVKSTWDNDLLLVTLADTSSYYLHHSSENSNDYSLFSEGRLDIDRDDRVTLKLGYDQQHEPRTSPDNTFGKTPTFYSAQHLSVESFDKFNRLSLNLNTNADKYEYTDVLTSVGNFIEEKDRDRWEYGETLRLGYEIEPDYEAFLRAAVDDRSYSHRQDIDGYQHSSSGGSATAGLAFDLTGVSFGEAAFGYMRRTYHDPRFSPILGWDGKVALTWNVTTLTTARLEALRDIAETVAVGASGIVNSTISLSLDHELLRQLILSGRVGLTQADYRNDPQRQTTLTGFFNATYRRSHNANFSVRFNHTNVDSNNVISSFSQNIITVSILLQL